MTLTPTHEVTQLLKAWTAGDVQALEKLTPLVYKQLHHVAQRYMAGERTDHTLQTTALVNEVYLRLVDCGQVNWRDRVHFLAVSARLMRRILIDFARARGYQKRGGGLAPMSLEEAPSVCKEPDENLLALDDALNRLAQLDAQQSRIVELRFFGGLTVQETAQALGISPAKVNRGWASARAWLYREMSKEVTRDARALGRN